MTTKKMPARGVKHTRTILSPQSLLGSKSSKGFSRRGSKEADEQTVLFSSMTSICPLIQSRNHRRSQLQSIGFNDKSKDRSEDSIGSNVFWLRRVNLLFDSNRVVSLGLFENSCSSRYAKRLSWRSIIVTWSNILNISKLSCWITFPLKFSTRSDSNPVKANGWRHEIWQASKLRFWRAESCLKILAGNHLESKSQNDFGSDPK